jgi:hypothetical protein
MITMAHALTTCALCGAVVDALMVVVVVVMMMIRRRRRRVQLRSPSL